MTAARPLLRAVVLAFLPAEGWEVDRLSAAERETVQRDVLVFVLGQVGALPGRLRLLFQIGLWLFALAVRLRHLRGFPALRPARRSALVQSLAFGRFALPRQFFRLIRSTALLAFYDHGLIRAALVPAEQPERRHASLLT